MTFYIEPWGLALITFIIGCLFGAVSIFVYGISIMRSGKGQDHDQDGGQ